MLQMLSMDNTSYLGGKVWLLIAWTCIHQKYKRMQFNLDCLLPAYSDYNIALRLPLIQFSKLEIIVSIGRVLSIKESKAIFLIKAASSKVYSFTTTS